MRTRRYPVRLTRDELELLFDSVAIVLVDIKNDIDGFVVSNDDDAKFKRSMLDQLALYLDMYDNLERVYKKTKGDKNDNL